MTAMTFILGGARVEKKNGIGAGYPVRQGRLLRPILSMMR
jgi:hypothetical protein